MGAPSNSRAVGAGPEMAVQTIAWLTKLSRRQTLTYVSHIIGLYFAADMLPLCGKG